MTIIRLITFLSITFCVASGDVAGDEADSKALAKTAAIIDEVQTDAKKVEANVSSDTPMDEIVRDVRELKKRIGRGRKEIVRFEIDATVLHYDQANYGIRLQHGGVRLFGRVTRSTSERPSFGSLVRMRGHSQPGLHRLKIQELDIIGDGLVPKPQKIPDRLPKVGGPLIGRYCRLSGRLTEISSTGQTHTALIHNIGGFHRWTLNAPMPVDVMIKMIGRGVTVDGIVIDRTVGDSKQPGLSAMKRNQMRPLDTYDSDDDSFKSLKRIDGVVIAINPRNWIAVSDNKTVHWLRSGLLFHTSPGDMVTAYYSPTNTANPGRSGIIRLLQVTGASTLKSPTLITASDTAALKQTLHPVTLEGTIRNVTARPGHVELLLSDRGTYFLAPIQLKNYEYGDEPDLRTGNVVRLTGVRESAEPEDLKSAKFRLIVNDPSTIQIVRRSLHVYAKQVGVITAIGVAILGCFAIWNGLLRSQVRLRTQDARSIATRLQASCDAICEGIFFFDSQSAMIQATGIARKLVGEETPKCATANEVRDRLRSKFNDSERFGRFWDESQCDQTGVMTQEFELADESGILSFYTTPVSCDQGTCNGRIWTVEDITLRKKMESEVIQSQKMQAVGQLAGGIAHDFNNLLMAISANLALAEMAKSDSSSVQRHLAIASDAVDRAATLTQKLLGFSRQSALAFQVSHMNDAVARTGELMRHLLNEHINFTQSMEPDLWPVLIDSEQIERVLFNLCINARDAMTSTKQDRTTSNDQVAQGQITVRTRNAHHHNIGDCVRIDVEDNGCGMSSDVVGRAFDPFFTTKDIGKGTGLGLAMAFGIVQQHGGAIECRSEIGSGSCFSVYLPKTEQPFDDESIHIGEMRLSKSETNASKTIRRVLVVDDEPMIRDAASALLHTLGHETVCVSDGQQALDLLSKDDAFDLVLLDLTMPVMSGSDALIQIKKRFPDLRVVICSGYSSDAQTLLKNEESAPDGFIAKPFRVDDIREFVDG